MPEYLSPGVYVEEVEIGGKPIEGVGTSTAGFIGETERGPTQAHLVTSMNEFQRLYGASRWTTHAGESKTFLPYAIEGFFANGGKRCFVLRILGSGSAAASAEVPAKSPEAPAPSPAAGPTAPPQPPAPPKSAFRVEASSKGLWGNSLQIKITEASQKELDQSLFRLLVFRKGNDQAVEEFDNLSPDKASQDHCAKRVNSESVLINVIDVKDGVQPARDKGTINIEKGSDGDAIGIGTYRGAADAPPGKKTGIAALTEIDEVSIVCAPNEHDHDGISAAIVQHCESMKDRFAVLQARKDADPPSKLRCPSDSKYAAFYYPWIYVVDSTTGARKLVPPCGHVAGIYARSDIERGVHKAPANEVVRGAAGLQFRVSQGVQDLLNPRGVNCIRSFVGRGIRVWGARTMSSDPSWKYVNVRRLFLYLEESIEEATQWVVFEPNDQRLWARVTQSISDFLTRVWRDGALMGTTPEEAFFVQCAKDVTMVQSDIDNGRLIIRIGVAPVKPAEFVIFRIEQTPSGSSVNE